MSKPVLQHGTYSFYFWDADDNCSEILTNPEGGYRWIFQQGDQEGEGHLDRNFKQPGYVTGRCGLFFRAAMIRPAFHRRGRAAILPAARAEWLALPAAS